MAADSKIIPPKPGLSKLGLPKLGVPKLGASKPGAKAAIRKMTDAQRDYEQKRAQKAGMTLDKWLDAKQRQAEAVQPKPVKPPRKPNLLSRLLERANKPLQKKP